VTRRGGVVGGTEVGLYEVASAGAT
jgi:hypothetical protein